MAALGMALAAGVVLVPAHARLVRARYERDCQRAQTADLAALAEAQERMIAALPADEILTMRLAISQESVAPSDRLAYTLPHLAPAGSPDLIKPVRHPRPPAPSGWLIRLDARLQKISTRRGLLLLALGFLMAAMFVFAPPEKYRKATDIRNEL